MCAGSPPSRRRTARSQASTCATISQTLCAPSKGRAAACAAVMPSSSSLMDGPCHAPPSCARLSCLAIRSASLIGVPRLLPAKEPRRGEDPVAHGGARLSAPPDGDRAADDDLEHRVLVLARHAAHEAADVVAEVCDDEAPVRVGRLDARLLEAEEVERPARPEVVVAQLLFEVLGEEEHVAEETLDGGRAVLGDVLVEVVGEALAQDAVRQREQLVDL